MKRTLSSEIEQNVGSQVTVKGWVHARRDHGGLIFIDVRDHEGLVQLVFNPDNKSAFTIAESLRDEYVISALGEVTKRDPDLQNKNIASGGFELVVEQLEVLNSSEPLPIQVHSDQSIHEDLRLKYRYLDLRSDKMQNILKRRAEYYSFMRSFVEKQGFIEIATPILANSSPEGARDFLIPSRIHEGKYYALPQAPQQFKQLLMVGGVPRYYQFAACFRDEDPRADRLYGEFYQLDLEMAFIESGQEVRELIEPLIKKLVTDFAGKKLITEDIPQITYQDSMDRFGTDKPDLRYGMELLEMSDELSETEFAVFRNSLQSGGVVKAILVKGGASLSRSQIDKFTEVAKSEGAGGLAYITYDSKEAKSPIVKFFSGSELKKIKEKSGASDGDAVFFAADTREIANKVLGRLRIEFADHFDLKDPNAIALAWVVDFPFYEFDEKTKKLDFGHNPFSMPKGGEQALDADNKRTIVADQYDMVMNGYEICSGAVRNHNPEVMYKAFGILGYDRQYVEGEFGAMLTAFKYGAPPHAGCAFGIDRMFMVLMGEENIREIVAFPKNGSGIDVLMNSPSVVDPGQLKELGL